MKFIQNLLDILLPTQTASVKPTSTTVPVSKQTEQMPCSRPGNPVVESERLICPQCGRHWDHPAHYAGGRPYPTWIDSDETAFASIFWIGGIERPTGMLKNTREISGFHWTMPALFHDNLVEIGLSDLRIWPMIVNKRQINAAVKGLMPGKLYPGWEFSLWEGAKCVAVGKIEKRSW